jgi:hypothetical protein
MIGRLLSNARLAAAVAIVVTGLVRAGGEAWIEAATDLTVDYDKAFKFAGLRTWSWHPDGKGDVRLAVSSDDDPARVAARIDPVIIPAIERELLARKFSQTTGPADLHVHYYALVTVSGWAQTAGQFVAPMPAWGLPPFTPSTTAMEIYPLGTLIIDITSPASRQIVWRGAARRKVDLERPDDERRKVLERAIRDLLRRFPPKN